jgi:hypothetical protein
MNTMYIVEFISLAKIIIIWTSILVLPTRTNIIRISLCTNVFSIFSNHKKKINIKDMIIFLEQLTNGIRMNNLNNINLHNT